MNIKQLKLVTGEEILAELVSREINEYDEEILFIRNAYILVSSEDFESQVRYYTFRPFMMHQYEPDKILYLNGGAVICGALPDKKVIEQYESQLPDYDSEDKEETDVEEDVNVVKFNPKLH
jgi:hypothetical protein